VILRNEALTYDSLIIGVSHHYFGNDDWEKGPGLKTVENALEIRRRILLHLKPQKTDPEKRRAWLTFDCRRRTTVELAGAIAELAYNTLKISAILTRLKPEFCWKEWSASALSTKLIS